MPPMALASVAAGADGLLMEMHPDPNKAMSDGAQSLYPEQLEADRTVAAAGSGGWTDCRLGHDRTDSYRRYGLIGASIGLALREAGYKGQIHGFDESLNELELALSERVIDDFAFGVGPTLEIARSADVIVLAVPCWRCWTGCSGWLLCLGHISW